MLRFEINTTNKSISEIIQDIKNITNQNKGIYEVIIDNLNPNANKFYLSLCDQILINKLKIKWFINT
ncbi:hypothetical protein HOK76_07785, partial [archaeon]|nr:hypothetical protein [archaeon]